MNLNQYFPTHVQLEEATVRAVAGGLLKVLHHRYGETHTFNIRNVLIEARSLYQVHTWECSRAVSEALSWLSAQSLICQAPEGDLGWCNLTRAGLQAAQATDFESWSAERDVPASLLHPVILHECMDSFRLGKFDTAVFEAFKTLEVAIRSHAGFDKGAYGVDMVRKAFQPDTGPLRDPTATRAEQEALQHLMAGAVGSYKNPHSHRKVEIGAAEAREMLVLASHLLRIVELRALA